MQQKIKFVKSNTLFQLGTELSLPWLSHGSELAIWCSFRVISTQLSLASQGSKAMAQLSWGELQQHYISALELNPPQSLWFALICLPMHHFSHPPWKAALVLTYLKSPSTFKPYVPPVLAPQPPSSKSSKCFQWLQLEESITVQVGFPSKFIYNKKKSLLF